MLEVRNLTKIYSGKGGVTVKALDDVSVVFPETGMVFLLGKSGSGKSTLLNVAGGLDKPDGGEVIVKGKSSRDFSGSDFDSYRNTFIGFVFQEYNILNEFTIEQNIALALQLQSKPNDKKAVADLLEQVDLAGYAKRKPNTLSGGQKQRVAIARALIKEPEIIMADEPTGALDSNTGKQVLDTLKKLSEKKLVIVVSHDREFAEIYGDRIIELKDGKIISDVSKVYNTPSDLAGNSINLSEKSDGEDVVEQAANVAVISDNTISIRDGGELTDAEVRSIAEMLRKQKGEVIITADKNDLPGVKRACKINDNGNKESFKETGPVEAKEYDGKKTKFIKSHLPLGHAIKMGASGLKSKPIRLIFTILLAVAAFVLFGVASTFMLYDPNYSVSEAMREANYPAATIGKEYTMKIVTYQVDEYGNREYDYDYDTEDTTRFGASEVASRSKNGLDYAGVFDFTDYHGSDGGELTIHLDDNYVYATIPSAMRNYYSSDAIRAMGFSDCGAEYMSRNGFSLIAGSYPTTAEEVALPAHLAEPFLLQENGTLKAYDTLVGKKIKFSFYAIRETSFTISGIYNVGSIPEKYAELKTTPAGAGDMNNEKDKFSVLRSSFIDYLRNSYNRIVFVAPDFYEAYQDKIMKNGGYGSGIQPETYKHIEIADYEIGSDVADYSRQFYTDKTISIFGADVFAFFDTNGNAVTYNSQTQGVYLYKERRDELLRYYADQEESRRRDKPNDYYYPITGNIRYVPAADAERPDVVSGDSKKEFDPEEEYEAKVAFVKKWFPIYVYRRYVYRAALDLRYSGDPAYESGAFAEAVQSIDNYMNGSTETQPADADWETIKGVVDANLSESVRYGYLLDVLKSDLGYEISLSDDPWTVISNLKSETLSAEELAEVKNSINSYLTEKGIGAIDGTTPFALADEAFVVEETPISWRVYYKDMTGSGTLPILGYFVTKGASSYTQYFVPSVFLDAHATYEPYQGTYQIQVMETSYSVPADAKYNYLITPTDNSQTQITSIFSTEADTEITLNSMVYTELKSFLDMIEELEEIFLYVGLGVGVLAAFFLLNFISVSIAAKKKDIGILRAVGARGSDVFKIFYAEAFIIAFICFVLASIGSYILCFFLNQTMAEVVSMKLLNFGLVNVGLVFGISLVVSVIATFFPVFFAARKSPVEAIRAL